jgi:DNA repair exonuclease SbcCD ATPase subunit
MEPTFAAAIEHIRVMEARIAKQDSAIERLRMMRENSSDAERRLKLLRAALAEMRTQLAQLTPTKEQLAAPAWALPLIAPDIDDTAKDATA